MDALGHGQIIVDTLTHESIKTQFTFYLGKFYGLFFDPAQWWWLEHILFLAYLSRLGRLRPLSGLSSVSLLQQSGRTLFPPLLATGWNDNSHKLMAWKEVVFL